VAEFVGNSLKGHRISKETVTTSRSNGSKKNLTKDVPCKLPTPSLHKPPNANSLVRDFVYGARNYLEGSVKEYGIHQFLFTFLWHFAL